MAGLVRQNAKSFYGSNDEGKFHGSLQERPWGEWFYTIERLRVFAGPFATKKEALKSLRQLFSDLDLKGGKEVLEGEE